MTLSENPTAISITPSPSVAEHAFLSFQVVNARKAKLLLNVFTYIGNHKNFAIGVEVLSMDGCQFWREGRLTAQRTSILPYMEVIDTEPVR